MGVTQKVGFSTSALVPASLAKADISASAVDQNGDKAACITAHLERQSSALAVVAADVASGGVLDVTWEDCGDASTHGRITDLQPTEITIGEDGTLTGTGTIDEELTDGSFTIKMTASLGIKETYTGNACEAKTFNLPLGIGTVSWGGLDCPVAAGTLTQKVGYTTASVVPAKLATADIEATAIDQNGDKAACITAHLERESSETEELAVGDNTCSADIGHCGKAYQACCITYGAQ